jgi:hypothetical protein
MNTNYIIPITYTLLHGTSKLSSAEYGAFKMPKRDLQAAVENWIALVGFRLSNPPYVSHRAACRPTRYAL